MIEFSLDGASESKMSECNDLEMVCSANSESTQTEKVSTLHREFIKRICYNPDPEVCFRNLLKASSNYLGVLFSFEKYIDVLQSFEFDQVVEMDFALYRVVFRAIYRGFKKRFKSEKINKSELYGPDAMIWCIGHSLVPADYNFKKQKIKPEEFAFIAYLLTKLCLKDGDDLMVHRNYFLGKPEQVHSRAVQNYKKYTGRRLNREKLSYILDVLSKANVVIERKIGVKGKTHLRNFYSIGENNPFYKYHENSWLKPKTAKRTKTKSSLQSDIKTGPSDNGKISNQPEIKPLAKPSTGDCPSSEESQAELKAFRNRSVYFQDCKYDMVDAKITIDGEVCLMDDVGRITIEGASYFISDSVKTGGFATIVSVD